MRNKKSHFKVMKEGKCEDYPEDGRDGRGIEINRMYKYRAKKQFLLKREQMRRDSLNSDGLAPL